MNEDERTGPMTDEDRLAHTALRQGIEYCDRVGLDPAVFIRRWFSAFYGLDPEPAT